MTDLVIIGAGLTGLFAGIEAARRGLRTRIIATGYGATHWTPGTIEVLGYLPGEDQPVRHPFRAIPRLLRAHPRHPYSRIDENQMREALARFQSLTQTLGLPYQAAAEPDSNLLLPSPAGAPRPVYLAPQGQIAGDMSRPEPYLIVGFHELRDFYPTLIAENLRKQGHAARVHFLPIQLITARRDFSPLHLAKDLDQADLTPLIRALKSIINPGERVGFPAILGFQRHTAILESLQTALQAPIFEIPTLPPSVPGIRLTQALVHHFQRDLHGQLHLGMTVTHHQAREHTLTAVFSQASARPVPHRARAFLLASGGILGGGFHSDMHGRVWEPIFHLPLDLPQARDQWFRTDFLDPRGHPVFDGGVRVNQHFQPVDASGQRVFDNLWAAGALLTDSDPIAERSLEGIALTTAYQAITAVSTAREK